MLQLCRTMFGGCLAGRGQEGQLGSGNLESSSVPVEVADGSTFFTLSAGSGFACSVAVKTPSECVTAPCLLSDMGIYVLVSCANCVVLHTHAACPNGGTFPLCLPLVEGPPLNEQVCCLLSSCLGRNSSS